MLPDAQAIIDLLPDLALLIEPDGRIVAANAALARALGPGGSSLVGRTLQELIETPAARAAEYLRRCSGSREPLPGALAFRRADGTRLDCRCDGSRSRLGDGRAGPILLRCRAASEAGSGFVLLNRKIAELTREIAARGAAEEALAQSERQFRSLADSIPQLVWMAGPDGAISWYNRRWYEYTGTTPAEIEGWGWQSVHDPDALPEVLERWRRSLATGEPFEMVFPLKGADGVFRAFLTRVAPLRDHHGRIERWFGTNTDISEQRAAEETLRRLNETLETRVAGEINQRLRAEEALRHAQKLEAIGQLTGGVAHDFNNLIQVILGNLDNLRRLASAGHSSLREQDFDRLVGGAMRGAERAAILTNRLLAFGRRQPLKPSAIDVNTLVAGMSDMLRRTLGETIGVETVLASGLWRAITDANQLESALLNLAVNARDAMPEGGSLTIETANASIDDADAAEHQDVAPGHYVMIAVSDTGGGMSKDVLARAFDPFFTTKEIGQGTGLGLSQVYGFAKQSGGHVKLDSEPGAGTVAKLYLPRAPAGAAAESRAEPGKGPSAARGEQILLVEDDDDVRASTGEMLRQLGYDVLEAPDGTAALSVIEAQPGLRLVVTDVGLPGGLSGRQLAQHARRILPQLKVLYASGYAPGAGDESDRLDAGAELIVKPFNRTALATKLRQMLES